MSDSEYKKRVGEDGEPVECDCCNYPGRVSPFPDTLVDSGAQGVAREDLMLCEVCANTLLSTARKYPGQCSDIKKLYISIAQLGNMILEAIRAEKNA